MIHIVPFGGCFVHRPVNYIASKFGERPLLTRMGIKGTMFSLSPNMNLQLVDFLTGNVQFPEWLKNISYSRNVKQPSKEQGELLYKCDLALVGLSTPIELNFEGAILNVNTFEEFISSELAGLASKKAISAWRSALLRGNASVLERATEELYKLIPRDTPEQAHLASFVRGVTRRTLSIDEMTQSTAELRDRLGLPMAFVLFNFMWMPDGRVVQWPATFKDDCIEVARRLSLRTIDYAPYVAQRGVDKMLMDDRRHFTAAAIPPLGELLYDFCLEVLERPARAGHAVATGQAPTETEAAAPEAPGASSVLAEASAGEVGQDAGAPRRYVLDEVPPAEFAARVRARKIASALRRIEAAASAEDFAAVARRSRDFLAEEPGNVEGLIHLARGAAFLGDWDDVAKAGAALTRESPRDAFIAAGKLNRAGRAVEAARIFVELKLRGDWFDEEARRMARTDSRLLQKAGIAATERGDAEAARVIWVAGARLAPQSHFLTTQVRQRLFALRATLADLDPEKDPDAYIGAYREMLWLDPASKLAAARLARALEASNETQAIDAWMHVLAVAPEHGEANVMLRRLAARRGLEDHVIQGLVELGRDRDDDPFIRELIDQRDARLSAAREAQVREALRRAQHAERDLDAEAAARAWKDLLSLDPTHVGAAKRIIGAASQAGDYTALVDALTLYLDVAPGDALLCDRLAAAALRVGAEQRALEYLLNRGLLGRLSESRIEQLRSRLFAACRSALGAADHSLARTHFRTLARLDEAAPGLEPLSLALADGLAASASEAETRKEFAAASLLAEQALELVPDHPVALTLLAREFWRDERFGELVEFCQPRVKDSPAYDALNMMLDKAMFAA